MVINDKELIQACYAIAKADAEEGEFHVEEHTTYMAGIRLKELMNINHTLICLLVSASEGRNDLSSIRKKLVLDFPEEYTIAYEYMCRNNWMI